MSIGASLSSASFGGFSRICTLIKLLALFQPQWIKYIVLQHCHVCLRVPLFMWKTKCGSNWNVMIFFFLYHALVKVCHEYLCKLLYLVLCRSGLNLESAFDTFECLFLQFFCHLFVCNEGMGNDRFEESRWSKQARAYTLHGLWNGGMWWQQEGIGAGLHCRWRREGKFSDSDLMWLNSVNIGEPWPCFSFWARARCF